MYKGSDEVERKIAVRSCSAENSYVPSTPGALVLRTMLSIITRILLVSYQAALHVTRGKFKDPNLWTPKLHVIFYQKHTYDCHGCGSAS